MTITKDHRHQAVPKKSRLFKKLILKKIKLVYLYFQNCYKSSFKYFSVIIMNIVFVHNEGRCNHDSLRHDVALSIVIKNINLFQT